MKPGVDLSPDGTAMILIRKPSNYYYVQYRETKTKHYTKAHLLTFFSSWEWVGEL